MITAEEYDILCSDPVREAVAAALGRDPSEVALDRRIPHARLVATQVKYLARARTKLPSYAAAQCILPPRAFEQASSERCAARKPIEGDALLDLTCGLGVDSLYLSRRFRRVVTLERDPVLAAVARTNFARLGVRNIEVVAASAEEYLASTAERFDWVYADPDRRSAEGRRIVRPEECSPDPVALMPRIGQVAGGRLCLKNSPLLDIDEAQRLFPGSRVEAVSLDGECKEVNILTDGRGPSVTAVAIGCGSFTAHPGATAPPPPTAFDPTHYDRLVVPDVALRKARLTRLHLAGRADTWSDNGFGFATADPGEVLGTVYAVERIEPYNPRQLRRLWGGRGAQLLRRDFPLAVDEVMHRLGLHPGAELLLALTKIDGRMWVIQLK